MLSLSSYKLIYQSISIVSKLLLVIFIYFFIYHSYQLYIFHKDFIFNFLKFSSGENRTGFLLNILLTELRMFGALFLQVSLVILVKYILFSLPVPKSLLVYWDSTKELTPILGRFITEHLRYHRYINSYHLYSFIYYSTIQQKMLIYHASNPNTLHLFKKHDVFYGRDSHNIS